MKRNRDRCVGGVVSIKAVFNICCTKASWLLWFAYKLIQMSAIELLRFFSLFEGHMNLFTVDSVGQMWYKHKSHYFNCSYFVQNTGMSTEFCS